MKFAEIPGLEKEKQVLINSVKNSHIAHAQLFFGNSGGGTFALALSYAQYINCENKQENDSCGECPSCSKYQKLVHPDLHFIYPTVTISKGDITAKANDVRSDLLIPKWREFLINNPYSEYNDWMKLLDVENKQGAINVIESRSILKKLSLKAFEAEYKVVFIWLPELMNSQASNALLKVLEEPPEKTLFLLISLDTDKLLTTILSRTQKFQVRKFNTSEIEEFLKSKTDDINKINQAILLSDGSLNKSIKNLSNAENDLFDFFRDWMRLCFQKNIEGIVSMSDPFHKLGRESQKNVLDYGIKLFRNILLSVSNTSEIIHLPEAEKSFVKKFASVMDEDKLEILFKLLNDAHYNILRNANPKLTFTNLSVEIMKNI